MITLQQIPAYIIAAHPKDKIFVNIGNGHEKTWGEWLTEYEQADENELPLTDLLFLRERAEQDPT